MTENNEENRIKGLIERLEEYEKNNERDVIVNIVIVFSLIVCSIIAMAN